MSAVVVTRDARPRPGLRELLTWRLDGGHTPEAQSAFYDHAHALFRFLLARNDSDDYMASVRAVHALSDDEIIALEPEWSKWLDGLDVLAEIERGLASRARSVQRESASLLPRLAERGVADVRCAAADALAIDLLGNDEASAHAAVFLLYFRAEALTGEQVQQLCTSGDPRLRITGLALRVRRGETVDQPTVARTWGELSIRTRRQFTSQRMILGIEAP